MNDKPYLFGRFHFEDQYRVAFVKRVFGLKPEHLEIYQEPH